MTWYTDLMCCPCCGLLLFIPGDLHTLLVFSPVVILVVVLFLNFVTHYVVDYAVLMVNSTVIPYCSVDLNQTSDLLLIPFVDHVIPRSSCGVVVLLLMIGDSGRTSVRYVPCCSLLMWPFCILILLFFVVDYDLLYWSRDLFILVMIGGICSLILWFVLFFLIVVIEWLRYRTGDTICCGDIPRERHWCLHHAIKFVHCCWYILPVLSVCPLPELLILHCSGRWGIAVDLTGGVCSSASRYCYDTVPGCCSVVRCGDVAVFHLLTNSYILHFPITWIRLWWYIRCLPWLTYRWLLFESWFSIIPQFSIRFPLAIMNAIWLLPLLHCLLRWLLFWNALITILHCVLLGDWYLYGWLLFVVTTLRCVYILLPWLDYSLRCSVLPSGCSSTFLMRWRNFRFAVLFDHYSVIRYCYSIRYALCWLFTIVRFHHILFRWWSSISFPDCSYSSCCPANSMYDSLTLLFELVTFDSAVMEDYSVGRYDHCIVHLWSIAILFCYCWWWFCLFVENFVPSLLHSDCYRCVLLMLLPLLVWCYVDFGGVRLFVVVDAFHCCCRGVLFPTVILICWCCYIWCSVIILLMVFSVVILIYSTVLVFLSTLLMGGIDDVLIWFITIVDYDAYIVGIILLWLFDSSIQCYGDCYLLFIVIPYWFELDVTVTVVWLRYYVVGYRWCRCVHCVVHCILWWFLLRHLFDTTLFFYAVTVHSPYHCLRSVPLIMDGIVSTVWCGTLWFFVELFDALFDWWTVFLVERCHVPVIVDALFCAFYCSTWNYTLILHAIPSHRFVTTVMFITYIRSLHFVYYGEFSTIIRFVLVGDCWRYVDGILLRPLHRASCYGDPLYVLLLLIRSQHGKVLPLVQCPMLFITGPYILVWWKALWFLFIFIALFPAFPVECSVFFFVHCILLGIFCIPLLIIHPTLLFWLYSDILLLFCYCYSAMPCWNACYCSDFVVVDPVADYLPVYITWVRWFCMILVDDFFFELFVIRCCCYGVIVVLELDLPVGIDLTTIDCYWIPCGGTAVKWLQFVLPVDLRCRTEAMMITGMIGIVNLVTWFDTWFPLPDTHCYDWLIYRCSRCCSHSVVDLHYHWNWFIDRVMIIIHSDDYRCSVIICLLIWYSCCSYDVVTCYLRWWGINLWRWWWRWINIIWVTSGRLLVFLEVTGTHLRWWCDLHYYLHYLVNTVCLVVMGICWVRLHTLFLAVYLFCTFLVLLLFYKFRYSVSTTAGVLYDADWFVIPLRWLSTIVEPATTVCSVLVVNWDYSTTIGLLIILRCGIAIVTVTDSGGVLWWTFSILSRLCYRPDDAWLMGVLRWYYISWNLFCALMEDERSFVQVLLFSSNFVFGIIVCSVRYSLFLVLFYDCW